MADYSIDEDYEDVESGNLSDEEDIKNVDTKSIIVYARDWTIDTLCKQIERGNINLNPAFQRRNAWNDDKRSKLIESIMIGYPVPEIILAEDMERKRTFIVIDGKQRILTLAGFINPEKYKYWDNPKLKGLKILKDFNGKTYQDFNSNFEIKTEFENSSLRCSVITNYKNKNGDDSVLYDLFYRLNSGSVKLSTQELRQSLYIGDFSNWLISITSIKSEIHQVMKLSMADKRMRDAEMLLRLLAFKMNAKQYKGNLKQFLDDSMRDFNSNWVKLQQTIEDNYKEIIEALKKLHAVFGDFDKVGRRYINKEYEKKFNRVILEVQVLYFIQIPKQNNIEINKSKFIDLYKKLCNDTDFRRAVEGSTKTVESYNIRYNKFLNIMQDAFVYDFKNPLLQ